MPKAVQADWSLIQQLYMEGLSLKELEAKTGVKQGTIASRATRANWKGLAARTKLELQTTEKASKRAEAEASDLSQHSKASRAALAKLLARSTESLEDLKVISPSRAIRISQDLEPLVRNCKTVFAWSESSTPPLVRINVLSGASVSLGQGGPATTPDPNPIPVLDAETVQPEQSMLNKPADSQLEKG